MTRPHTYAESILYLENALWQTPIRPAREMGLRRAAFLLEQAGNPQLHFRSVHITGSCGKGSTAAMIASILRSAGFSTGLFSSPHLVSYVERISANGEQISETDWARLFDLIYPIIEGMRLNSIPGYDLGRPSLFEIFFTLACLYLAESGVAWAVLEAGIGGRLDAPTVKHSDVAVITNVSLEHTKMLGDTVREIAREKAAIIAPETAAVTAAADPEALSVIRERVDQVGSSLYQIGKDVRVTLSESTAAGQELILSGRGRSLRVTLPLLGSFQAMNSGCAFAAALALQDRGVPVAMDAVKQGLETVSIEGRFELVPGPPGILLDGAHNPAAAETLAETLRQTFPDRRIVMVFAAMADKDIHGMATALGPLADVVFLTKAPDTERAAVPQDLVAEFLPVVDHIMVENDADEALRQARRASGPTDLLVICGSLYLVGYLRPRVLEMAGVV